MVMGQMSNYARAVELGTDPLGEPITDDLLPLFKAIHGIRILGSVSRGIWAHYSYVGWQPEYLRQEKALHRSCLALEKHELIYRHIEDEQNGRIFWMPVEVD